MNFGFLTLVLALVSSTEAFHRSRKARIARCKLPIWHVQSMSADEIARYQAFYRRFCSGKH